MRLFASVIEHGNIAQAARASNIAASAISKRISDMEDRVGAPLIQRLRDGVEPTDAGRALYRHIKGLGRAMDLLKAELSEFSEGARGEIRIWANPSAVTQFLPEDIKAYLDEYPAVRIELREDTSGQIVEAIRDGRADLGLFSEYWEAIEGIETRVYRRDTLMVIAPLGHPLAGRERVSLAETIEFDHIGLQGGSSLQDRVLKAARGADTEIRLRIQVLSFDGVRRMVEAGLGVAILPQGAVQPYVEGGAFAAVHLDEAWATRNLLLGYRDYAALSIVARQMIEMLAPGDSRNA